MKIHTRGGDEKREPVQLNAEKMAGIDWKATDSSTILLDNDSGWTGANLDRELFFFFLLFNNYLYIFLLVSYKCWWRRGKNEKATAQSGLCYLSRCIWLDLTWLDLQYLVYGLYESLAMKTKQNKITMTKREKKEILTTGFQS